MQKFSIMLALAFLSGCGTLANTDHRSWTTVSCSGFTGWDACKKTAAEACPRGYDVANQRESAIAQHRSMEYACKQ